MTKRTGRPPHQPSDETRATVVRLVGEGKNATDIAAAIGISAPTLRAHYRQELHDARAQKRIPLPEFDDPAPPGPGNPGSGRPPHVPTDDTRQRVEILRAAGMPAWQIAQTIGIGESALREHYAAEIEAGRARKRAEMIAAMFEAGRSGNVSAQRAFLALDADLDDPPEPPAREAPIGKKEAAMRAAEHAAQGTSWASLLPH
jgi:hypothetical protein